MAISGREKGVVAKDFDLESGVPGCLPKLLGGGKDLIFFF